MKAQTLFIVASAIIGALAAPVQRREAQPDVMTVYENVVHIVTTTSTVWVAPSKPTPAPAPEKKVEEVKEEPEVVEEPKEEPEEETEEVEVKKPAPIPTPTPTPTPSPKPAPTSVYVPPTTKAEPTQAPAPIKAPEPAPEPEQEEEEVEASAGDQKEASTSGSSGSYDHSGEGTFYDPAVGSCGNTESSYVAALPKAVMEAVEGANPNNNPLCGKMVEVSRDGSPEKVVKVKVVDKCMGCAPENIDLSLDAFLKLGEESEGRIKVNWKMLN